MLPPHLRAVPATFLAVPTEVRKTPFLRCFYVGYTRKRSVCQDRLGTNIGQAERKAVSAGSLTVPHAGGPRETSLAAALPAAFRPSQRQGEAVCGRAVAGAAAAAPGCGGSAAERGAPSAG